MIQSPESPFQPASQGLIQLRQQVRLRRCFQISPWISLALKESGTCG
jgi:hypothetical protein